MIEAGPLGRPRLVKTPIAAKLCEIARFLDPAWGNMVVNRAYTNYLGPSDAGMPHPDCDPWECSNSSLTVRFLLPRPRENFVP